MPFTPWHLGPGLAFKALGGRRLSFCTFAASQVFIDVEVLIRIFANARPLHGYTHSIPGAVVVAAVTAAAVGPALMLLQRWRTGPGRSAPSVWPAVWAGALVGTLSHVALDAIMHGDMRPFWPVSDWNPLLRIGGMNVHDLCFWSGAVGGVAIVVLAAWRRWRPRAG